MVIGHVRANEPARGLERREGQPARLLLHIFAAFAEFERELIRERVVTGICAAQERGTRLGRRRRVVRRDQAVRLRSVGKSWREIATMLGVPFSTVIDACRAESTRRSGRRRRR
jgi:DNA invertase Pin-like site-specific DNA recombinase